MVQYSKDLGLNATTFQSDLTAQDVIQRVNSDEQQATDLQLAGTPTLFVNGKEVSTPSSYDALLKLVNVQ